MSSVCQAILAKCTKSLNSFQMKAWDSRTYLERSMCLWFYWRTSLRLHNRGELLTSRGSWWRWDTVAYMQSFSSCFLEIIWKNRNLQTSETWLLVDDKTIIVIFERSSKLGADDKYKHLKKGMWETHILLWMRLVSQIYQK